jgi:hypothetical protein
MRFFGLAERELVASLGTERGHFAVPHRTSGESWGRRSTLSREDPAGTAKELAVQAARSLFGLFRWTPTSGQLEFDVEKLWDT